MSTGNSRSFFTSAGMLAWDMSPGSEMSEFTEPKDTVILKRPDLAAAEATWREKSYEPVLKQ
eukprot:CAMPEP_0118986876 /NCGR_PEP_ID=MMETSP1173-20130426/43021_1 /TAXON_ID=1034831 /ORGANISM="Rhizochromulina marina cf, Strain CCMP1243" /LENGTH=61 /DNA_ID=CAMNT_0006937683 /DNA_START=286 /DNA_END=468 /DNA_ORIENTATION=+